jgi:hypothetical protein
VSSFHIYADESRQTGHPYMLYGMIFSPAGASTLELERQIITLRDSHRFGAEEIKWNSTSKKKVDLYKSVVDVFFEAQSASFRCMKIEPGKIERHKYHEGDHETAFYWGYGMALSRNLQAIHEYEIFMDARTDERPNRVADLRASINAHWIQKQLAQKMIANEIVRDIKTVDSKKYNLLQITDVLTGAVGFAMEKRDESLESSPAKIELMKHIADRIGCECLATHHGLGTRFNIWNFRFRTQEERVEYEERQKEQRVATDS